LVGGGGLMAQWLNGAPRNMAYFVGLAIIGSVSPGLAQSDKASKEAMPEQQPIVWKWTNFELMGHHSVSREKITKHIPLKIGTDYQTDRESWKKWSADLEKQFDFHSVKISAVRFVGGKAYLVVNVIERGNERVLEFRPTPTGSVELPADVLETYRKMSTYSQSLFEKGTPPHEKSDDGFLDYEEAEMSQMATELFQIVPQHRLLLLKALDEESELRIRATAATLLNWAGDVEKSMVASLPYLDDPSSGVRNNLTRFMLHYFDRVESAESRRQIIDAIIPQLSRPSHGDRNKAIYALSMLAEKDDDSLDYIMSKAGKQIRYIADNSILFNVRDPAKELLKSFEKRKSN
jgi:hypothetical protein